MELGRTVEFVGILLAVVLVGSADMRTVGSVGKPELQVKLELKHRNHQNHR